MPTAPTSNGGGGYEALAPDVNSQQVLSDHVSEFTFGLPNFTAQASQFIGMFDEPSLTPGPDSFTSGGSVEDQGASYSGEALPMYGPLTADQAANTPIIYVIIEVDDFNDLQVPLNWHVDKNAPAPDAVHFPVYTPSEEYRKELRAQRIRYQNEHGDNSFWEDSNHWQQRAIQESEQWFAPLKEHDRYVHSTTLGFQAFDESMTDSMGVIYTVGKEIGPLGYAKNVSIAGNFDGAQSGFDRTLAAAGVAASWFGWSSMGTMGRTGKAGLTNLGNKLKFADELDEIAVLKTDSTRYMGIGGTRNTVPLTTEQIDDVKRIAKELGLEPGDVHVSYGKSSYRQYEDFDFIQIGPDAIPLEELSSSKNVFERLSLRSVIAHEGGHLITTRAGKAFPAGSFKDEIIATMAGRDLPSLSAAERHQMLRYAVELAREGDIDLRAFLNSIK